MSTSKTFNLIFCEKLTDEQIKKKRVQIFFMKYFILYASKFEDYSSFSCFLISSVKSKFLIVGLRAPVAITVIKVMDPPKTTATTGPNILAAKPLSKAPN